MRTKIWAAGIALLLALAGCSASVQPAGSPQTPAVTATVTQAPPSAFPSVKQSLPSAVDVDRTADVRSIAGERVTAAVESARGEFVVSTDIVDPRGADGSDQAQQALAICEALRAHFGATNVRVQEEDGSTFVAFGGTRKQCTEF